MLQDVLQMFSHSHLEYNKYSKIVNDIQNIWCLLLKEYNLSVEDYPLTIINSNVYPNTAARRLAALGFNVDPKDFELNLQEGTAPIFLTSSSVIFREGYSESLCTGVFGMADYLLTCMKNDGEGEIPIKLQCIEILLRHEIGHILSTRELYNHRTREEYNAICAKIASMTNDEVSRWTPGIPGDQALLNHYNLPLEMLANTAVRITPQMVVDAACILVEVL